MRYGTVRGLNVVKCAPMSEADAEMLRVEARRLRLSEAEIMRRGLRAYFAGRVAAGEVEVG